MWFISYSVVSGFLLNVPKAYCVEPTVPPNLSTLDTTHIRIPPVELCRYPNRCTLQSWDKLFRN